MRYKNKPGTVILVSMFLILFLILAPFTVSASSVQKVEIRGPVYNGSDIVDIINTYGFNGVLIVDATEFAAFYYDIDDEVTTETLSIKNVYGTEGNVIGEGGLVYTTTVKHVAYQYQNVAAGWSNYSLIGFFGEQYIPINPDRADKLSKLVLDSDDIYTVKTGETLDLGKGYALGVKQIDVVGNKVWLEFTRDGEFVDDEIVSVVNNGTNTWNVALDGVQGEDDVVVLKVHLNQIFQGENGNISQIEGIWLIDYVNAMTIEPDDNFGVLDNVNINGNTLIITNEDTFILNRDSTDEIAQRLAFKTADTSSNMLRFCIMTEITEPGTYEIRGQIASGTGAFRWDATNFAGFYYDLNDDVSTESLSVSDLKQNVIPAGKLVYQTSVKTVDYKYSNSIAGWYQYPVIGFFGEECIPIKPDRADKLAKLVLDSDDKYTLRTGEQLDLGEGYAIEVKQIDAEGEKVWLEFTKDGEYVDDEIISVSTSNPAANTWVVELDDIQRENNVAVLKVHVNQVFQDATDSIAQIEGLWLIDYVNAMTIESDDEFGNLNKVNINGDTLTITNEDDLTLTRGNKVEIGQGMFFKIADTSTTQLRYYPFIEYTIEEHKSKVLPIADFSTSVTGGYAPLSVSFTDLSQNVTSWSWDFGDGVTSTEQNPTHVYSEAGTYTIKLTAINSIYTNEKTAQLIVDRKSSGSSHGGGGGGGGSPEPARNVEVKELSQVFITNGKAIQFNFTKNATCVVSAGFDAKKTVGKTTTIVEQLKNKSTLVSNLSEGEVYRYFNVWVGNSGFASSDNIENPTICFKVKKSWIQDKKIDQDSITLNRYSDKKWEQLPVSLSGEDSEYLYFTADVPGYSFFAITGKTIASENKIQPVSQTQNMEEKARNISANVEQEYGPEKTTGLPGFAMIYGIISLFAVYRYKRK
jgi:S-layer protein (TIGR01567 family)